MRNALDGLEALYLGVCFLVLFALVLLRGIYSGYRVGGLLLMALVAAGLVAATIVGLLAAVRRRWTSTTTVLLGGYAVGVVAIIAIDLVTG